jgi:alkanesulfonate monooxygenase SsuD/methylene tetrahydromethanopterin reductase-like flavin-dependent oxidoreductase (luciferase family)
MGRDSQRADNAARGQTMAQAARDYQFNIDNGLTLVGSPDTIVRQLQAGQARVGYNVFCTNHQIGRMPSELVNRSIELFGKVVIPAFASAPVGAR